MPIGVVATLSGCGVLALSWWYAGADTAGRFDASIIEPLVVHGWQRHLTWLVADLGSPPALLLGMVGLVVAARRTGRRAALWLAVAGPLLAVALTEFVLKPLVGRTYDGGLSLPSGRATCITSIAWVLVLAFVAVGLPAAGWLRAALVALAVSVVAAVSLAVVALQVHYPTDALAGMLVGTAVVGAVALALDRSTRFAAASLPG